MYTPHPDSQYHNQTDNLHEISQIASTLSTKSYSRKIHEIWKTKE